MSVPTFEPIAQFSRAQWATLESLRSQVSQAIAWPLSLEAGATEDGRTWAAICLHERPSLNECDPGPLVTIATHEDSPEVFEVCDRHGAPVLGGLTFDQADTLAEYVAHSELGYRVETMGGKVCDYPELPTFKKA